MLLGELVLPETQHAPAASAKLAGDKPVAGLVGGDLPAPEFRVLFGLGGVERAAVPEAAVDEDGDAELGENEVGADAEGEPGWADGGETSPSFRYGQGLGRSGSAERFRGSTGRGADDRDAPPAGDAESAKDGDAPQLGGGVARALHLA